jgi:hypothetical protein
VRQQRFYYQCEAPEDLLQLLPEASTAVTLAREVTAIPTGSAALSWTPDRSIATNSIGSSEDGSSDAASGTTTTSTTTGSSSSSTALVPEEDGQAIISSSSLNSDILSTSSSNLLPSAAVAAAVPWTQADVGLTATGHGGHWGLTGTSGALPPMTPTVNPREAGKKIYTRIKIDTDYDVLVTSPLRMARFKTDLLQWLRSGASTPEYVYSAGRQCCRMLGSIFQH